MATLNVVSKNEGPVKKKIGLYMESDLIDELKEVAETNGVSLNALSAQFLQFALEQYNEDNAPAAKKRVRK